MTNLLVLVQDTVSVADSVITSTPSVPSTSAVVVVAAIIVALSGVLSKAVKNFKFLSTTVPAGLAAVAAIYGEWEVTGQISVPMLVAGFLIGALGAALPAADFTWLKAVVENIFKKK